jgi:hypothetical protein
LEIADKAGFNLKRLLGFHVEQNNRSGFMHWDEERFSHAKRVARVKDRGGFRMHGQSASQAFRGQGSIAYMKCQMKFAEDFQRIDPSLELPSLIPEQSSARAGDRKKFPGPHRAREFEGLRRGLGW